MDRSTKKLLKMVVVGVLTYTVLNKYFPNKKSKFEDPDKPSPELPSGPGIRLGVKGGSSAIMKHILKLMAEDANLIIALTAVAGVYMELNFREKLIEVIKGALVGYSYLPGDDTIVTSMRTFKDEVGVVTSKKAIELLSENHKFTRAEKLAYLKLYIKNLVSWQNLKTKKSYIAFMFTLLVLTAIFGAIPYGAFIVALVKFLVSGKLDENVKQHIIKFFLREGIPLPPELNAAMKLIQLK